MNRLKKIIQKQEVKKYFFNTSWMLGEKVFTMGLGMIVSIIVARYLGPHDFGILSYAISLTSLFAIATHMGLKGLAVRELVNTPDNNDELMGTIFGIKFTAGILALVLLLVFIFYTGEQNTVEFWVLVVVSGTIIMKPFEVFDFWFQAKVKAKYSSIVRSIAVITLSILKIGLVLLSAQLLAFASAYLLQALLIAILFIFFFKKKSALPLKNWRFNFGTAKKLLGQGWMIMLGSIFAIVYLKIDQVMLRFLVNAEEVGIYSVAAKLSEAWYFIPTAIVASLFPKLIELHKKDEQQFKKRLQQLIDLLFGIACGIAILITLISDPVVNFLYGVEFGKAALILSIHVWAGIFIFMRAAFSKWMLVEDAIAFSMITHGLGAIFNIILNILLIPLYSGVGAALATLISYAISSYFSLIFHKKSRLIFRMMTNSLVLPFRFTYKVLTRT